MSDALPALPDECWPVDDTVCAGVDDLPDGTWDVAVALAAQSLRMLTGYRVGGCPVTVRPCSNACVATSSAWYSWGTGWMPYVNGLGQWVNGCCGASACDHLGAAMIVLPGPVGAIEEILIDGEVVEADTYRVDNGNELVRLDGAVWPTIQDMTLGPDEVGAFAVTYLRGVAVDGLGARAAGLLACEFSKALTGQKCKLPAGVTSISRQGVTMEILPGAFPGGRTGVQEVDLFVQRWNPNALKAPTTVWSPDVGHARTTQ